MKVTKSSRSRGILLKETTRKVTCQEGGFFNFLRPLMAAALPLIKSVLTLLAKTFCYHLYYQQECQQHGWVRNYSINNFK